MKRGIALTLIAVIVILTALSAFIFIKSPTGKAVFTPSIPSDCSDASIKATWDSIFQESSNGAAIFKNSTSNGCGVTAYKININETYILRIERVLNEINIIGIHANLTENSNFLSSLKNISGVDEEGEPIPHISGINTMELIPRNTSLSEATSRYNTYFKISPLNWRVEFGDYMSNDSFKNLTEEIIVMYMISPTYSEDGYIFWKKLIPSCTPNWTAYNTSCLPDERKTTYFRDPNYCNQTAPANITLRCDYDRNGVIGSDIDLKYRTNKTGFDEGLFVYVNSSILNLSQNYSGTRKVELSDEGMTIIEFNWDFNTPLNLDSIEVEKQGSASKKGYLLIRGINVDKKVWMNKINPNSTEVCVKTRDVSSISEITADCTGSNEYSVPCPGTDGDRDCEIAGSYFKVSGVENSGIAEILPSAYQCSVNWSCTSWGLCINNNQTRNCIETNNCSTTLHRPSLSQNCTPTLPACTPIWSCTNWSRCINNSKTRTCSDSSNCNTTAGRPELSQDCGATSTGSSDGLSSSTLFLVIVSTTTFLIIIIFAILIYTIFRGDKKPSTKQKPPATQYGYQQFRQAPGPPRLYK